MSDGDSFMKPIQKKSSSHLPAVTGNQGLAAPDYDPIKRLGEELSRITEKLSCIADINENVLAELAHLKQRLDKAEGRPQPATYEQIVELADKQPSSIKVDAKLLAKHVQPALVAALPSTEQLQAAGQAVAAATTASGLAAANQIRQAGADAANRIEWATVASSNTVFGFLGFRSWKQAVVLCFIPLLLAGACSLAYWREYQERDEVEKELQEYRNFGGWIKKNYPMAWKKYNP